MPGRPLAASRRCQRASGIPVLTRARRSRALRGEARSFSPTAVRTGMSRARQHQRAARGMRLARDCWFRARRRRRQQRARRRSERGHTQLAGAGRPRGPTVRSRPPPPPPSARAREGVACPRDVETALTGGGFWLQRPGRAGGVSAQNFAEACGKRNVQNCRRAEACKKSPPRARKRPSRALASPRPLSVFVRQRDAGVE